MNLYDNECTYNKIEELNNVYDIRFHDRLYFTLPKNYLINKNHIFPEDACVIIYLYYSDSLFRYHYYINNAINTCDVCIITSNKKLFKELNNEFAEYSNVQVRMKQNRGRDVAALLVTAKDIFDKYQFVCFVHDKKEKVPERKETVDTWICNLWECTLGSEKYIRNVINLFQTREDSGLFIPPEMIDNKMGDWYEDKWNRDFELTYLLAKDIGLKTDLDENKPPIALGTVFWCRSDALKKLWNINWTYESFDAEPLPNDGTISHAVERIFPYVAQDAGFKTATVMTEEENARILSYTQVGMHDFYKILSDELGVVLIDDALKYQIRTEKLRKYYNEHKEIYIYGNGSFSKRCLKLIKHLNIPVSGIIVSDKKNNKNEMDLGIYSISEISNHIKKENCGIVIGVSELYISEITDILKSYNITNYLVL